MIAAAENAIAIPDAAVTSAALDQLIDLKEASTITGYSLTSLYIFCRRGDMASRHTAGVWFTTRAEAERLRNRGKLKRGPKPRS
jgi:hypothetical protein